MGVRENLEEIQMNIASICERVGRDSDVQIIAVTKYVSTKRAEEAWTAGVTHFGENRDEGLLSKCEALGHKPTWHFIGTLQSRKVKNIVEVAEYIHSLDRLTLAEEINKRATKKIKCFIQVNASGEQSKHGLEEDEVLPFIEQLQALSNIEIVGLMTMAPFTDNEQEIRTCFQKTRKLQQFIQKQHIEYAPCNHLSMGMSNDYMIAVEEGATFLRIGSSLVGEQT